MILPDYHGGSLVNLMASIEAALARRAPSYATARALEPAVLKDAATVVLLVVDGMGEAVLDAMMPDGALAAHRRGRLTSVFPSTTATAVTTFLTGLAPRAHAVPGWFTWFKEIGSVTAVLPFRTRAGGADLARLGVRLGDLLGTRPLFEGLDAEVHTVSPARIVHSAFNAWHCAGTRMHAYERLDEMFAALLGIARRSGGRRYVYAYFPEVDSLAHAYGVGSEAVRAQLRALDAAFADFVQAASGTDTAVIVTADHGLIDSPPPRCVDLADHPRLADTLVLPLCGEPRVAYCYVRGGEHGRFEQAVAESLGARADLHRSAELVEQGLFGPGPTHPRLAERLGDYVLVMRDDWTLRDRLAGETRYEQVGVHGGLSTREMQVPLIFAAC